MTWRTTEEPSQKQVETQSDLSRTQDEVPTKSPEEIGSPDDSQVFGVHVSGGAEGGQVGQMSHEVFQSPAGGKNLCLVC